MPGNRIRRLLERSRQAAAITSQGVVLLGALGAIMGWATGSINQLIERQFNSRIEKQLRDEKTPLGKLQRLVSEVPPSSIPLLGDWQPVVVGQVYTAESDGFLLAFSGGKGGIATLYLETGGGDLTGRTRAGRYDGAATPVKRGHRYRVKVGTGDRGTITAYWIPLK